MTDGLGTAVLAITAVLILIGIGLVWWVLRPDVAARAHEDHEGPRIIPLFGVDRLVESGSTGGDGDGERPADRPAAPVLRATPARGAAAMDRALADDGHQQLLGDRRFAPNARIADRLTPAPGGNGNGNGSGVGHGPAHEPLAAPTSGTNGRTSGLANLHARPAAAAAPDARADSQAIRFSVPAEGTLQFLPGRLEVEAGSDLGREIRFVRTAGPEGTEVTFGRNEGALYRHVQLHDQTVSRLHARMELRDGQWYLTNLSTTNPLSLNGRVLGVEEEQPLAESDRIEMGEVIFRFRSR